MMSRAQFLTYHRQLSNIIVIKNNTWKIIFFNFLKDFLNCTPINHPDYQYLIKAQKELHNLAEKIDQVHKEVNDSQTYGADSHTVLQIIQDLIENLDDVFFSFY